MKFRSTSTFQARHGLLPDAQGIIVNVRNGPDPQKLIDVKFPKTSQRSNEALTPMRFGDLGEREGAGE